MKNKGFTLVEVLAVMVILTILVTIAALSYTRYRVQVDDEDLKNLHSTIETSYNNYRTAEAVKGNIVKNVSFTGDNSSAFSSYIDGIGYGGKKLDKTKLDIVVELRTKGEVLGTEGYDKYVSREKRKTKIEKSGGLVKATSEDMYVIDSTCEVESKIVGDTIEQQCVGLETYDLKPSPDPLVCIIATYKGNVLFNDYDAKTTRNVFCSFLERK